MMEVCQSEKFSATTVSKPTPRKRVDHSSEAAAVVAQNATNMMLALTACEYSSTIG
jgi:hypothetical protein